MPVRLWLRCPRAPTAPGFSPDPASSAPHDRPPPRLSPRLRRTSLTCFSPLTSTETANHMPAHFDDAFRCAHDLNRAQLRKAASTALRGQCTSPLTNFQKSSFLSARGKAVLGGSFCQEIATMAPTSRRRRKL